MIKTLGHILKYGKKTSPNRHAFLFKLNYVLIILMSIAIEHNCVTLHQKLISQMGLLL